MTYLNKFCSLKERAFAQIAINFCQESNFKEVALCLEKPTYGLYLSENSSPSFISDPVMLSVWAKVSEAVKKGYDQKRRNLVKSYYEAFNEADQWDVAVHKQCLSLTESLPHSLRHGISYWMSRIALEYLSFFRRQELFFGVSRYFLMEILSREDWMEDCRLDEEKIAKRMIQDERLTVLQRFRMACVHCLCVYIHALWIRLTLEEKQIVNEKYSGHPLVVFWSRYMETRENENAIQTQNSLWADVANKVVQHGNRTIMEQCWKNLTKSIRQQQVIDLALESLQCWLRCSYSWKKKFLSNMWVVPTLFVVEHFNLPSYYNELVRFFLTEMSEVELLTFFQKTFQETWQFYEICVLECLLDWPHQHNILPFVRRLWGIIPMDMYGHFLLAVARKYGGDCENKHKLLSLERSYCDYRSLLSKLWKKTPKEYKRYLFSNQETEVPGSLKYAGQMFRLILNRSPFNDEDEKLFRRIWCGLLPEQKAPLMRSEVGKNICSLWIRKDNWSFLNSLIQDTVPVEEIPIFRKKFICSKVGNLLCLYKLKNREYFLEYYKGLSLECYYKILIFEYDILDKQEYLDIFNPPINENEWSDVRCELVAHILSYEKTGVFHLYFLQYACRTMLKDYSWNQLDNLLAWSFDAEEEIRNFKKELFSGKGTDTHYELVFIERRWGDVGSFYIWFCLSPEEIISIKKETIMTPKVIEYVHKTLCSDPDALVASLGWCVTDEEMLMRFKENVKAHFQQISDEDEKLNERFDCLMRKLLCNLSMENEEKHVVLDNILE